MASKSDKLPFFKFDIEAWLTGKIQVLEATEKGIFIDLVARIWLNHGALQNTPILARLLRVEKATLSEALQAFFELGIMREENGFLRVNFIDEQLKVRVSYIEQQARFGQMGGRPKKGTKPKKKEDSRKKIEDNSLKEDKSSLPPKPEKSGNSGSGKNLHKIFFDYDGDSKIHGITPEQLNLWKNNFPAIDVEQELKSASSWLDANRKNRKKDVKRFLNNWLTRHQEHAPRVIENNENQKGFENWAV